MAKKLYDTAFRQTPFGTIYTGQHFGKGASNTTSKPKKATPSYTPGKKNTSGTTKSDLSNYFNNYVNGLISSSGGGGGVSAGSRIDLTPYINALKEGAAANKKTISDTYTAQRNQLAQALKAYQENTATARRQAMEAFNSARADLEEDAYMNMRAAQQSAASRGLGGSGLQQLAQLSSQIESSNQTSNLSEQNTDTQNELTKALKDYENSVNTQTNDLTTEERNKLTEIDTNVSQAIAQAQYNEEVRYQEALQQAAATNASLAASAQSNANSIRAQYAGVLEALTSSMYDTTETGIEAIQKVIDKRDSYKSGKAYQNALDKAYDKYDKQLRQAQVEAGLGDLGINYYNYYRDQLRNAYNSADSILAPLEEPSFWDRLFG